MKGVGLFMFFSRNGESFFFLGNSFSGKRAEALILGVGGCRGGRGSGCVSGDFNELGEGVSFVVVIHYDDGFFLRCVVL